ncbi:TIGR03915 family putative DNA repair protein [Kushneria aurantia]|uniref:TIGR03915 family putative DNA repair protein n=1 Tax=Kushneria aurantia TaxID=504092 RepID=A0ABV6G4S2_9GAMM|nr:TIGR03915 family putative DNA repair protein [Kushneria aurantia]
MTLYTVRLEHPHFDCWREHARQLLARRLPPEAVLFENGIGERDLFADADTPLPDPSGAALKPRLTHRALAQLERASRYCIEPQRECGWSLLYRVVWRLALGEGEALLAGDTDGAELARRARAVDHEAHHMHAFLRFQRRYREEDADSGPAFIAWFEPRHEVLADAAEHFIQRMGRHSWLIMTPRGAISCDGRAWHIERPARQFCHDDYRALLTLEDEGEALWLAYYASTFNPSRVNEKCMRRSMPARFWQHLPEQSLIAELAGQARRGGRRSGQDRRLAGRHGRVIAAPRRDE